MKKIKVLFMVIFILLFASCGKPREVNITDTEIREGITYVKGETKAFTGIIKSYYENGNLESEGNFKDGKLNGLSKLYYENGNLKSEANFKDDKLEGLSKEYYENGNISTEANFKDDKLEGLLKLYYENGYLIAQYYYKDGKKIY